MNKNLFTTITLIILSAVVYILTAPKGIYTGDSGEIATAVWTWGIAHPTGFPVYLILGKLFSSLLFFLEPAYALNIFSCITSALTVGILFLILQRLKLNYWASVVASLLYAFASTVWSHANVARVYSLTMLFFALGVLIFLWWINNPPSASPLDYKGGELKLIVLAIVCALGVGTHLTFLLIFPFFLIYLIVAGSKNTMRKKLSRLSLKEAPRLSLDNFFLIVFLFVFLCLAVLIYSYIPFRASQSPDLNWGNPSTKESFINYITQQDYSDKIGTRDFESWKLMAKEVGKNFANEFTILGFALILAGAWISKKNYRAFLIAGVVVIWFNILLLGNYGNKEDIVILYRYFLPSYFIMAIFLGIGLDKILDSLSAVPTKRQFIFLLLPIFIFAFHFQNLNRSNYNLVSKTTENILESTPQNSILITSGDTLTGALMYEQKVLKNREDLILIDDKLYTHDWYLENKKREIKDRGLKYEDNLIMLINNNIEKGIYSISNSISFLKMNFDFYSHGLVYKLKKKNAKEIFSIKETNNNFWENRDLKFLENKRLDKEYFNKEIAYLYTTSLNNYSAWLINNGYIKEGTCGFEKSVEIRENKTALYNLWGIYNELGDKEKREEYGNKFNNFK